MGIPEAAAVGQGEGRCGGGGEPNISPGCEPQLYLLRKHVPLSPLMPLSNAHSQIRVIAPSLGHPLRLQGYFPCGEGGIYSENSH